MVESRAQADAINSRMNRKDYEKELRKLQIGLCRLQDWVKHKGGCGSSSCSKDVMQRYIRHFPAAGEVVIFDRSWYNRAGVEYVMGSGVRRDAQVGRSDGRSDEAPPLRSNKGTPLGNGRTHSEPASPTCATPTRFRPSNAICLRASTVSNSRGSSAANM